MHFSTVSALLGFVASVVAQTADFDPIFKPASGEEVTVGTTYTITWDAPEKYAAGTVKLHLIGGAEQNMQVPLYDIASGIANSDESYAWTIPTTESGKAFYGIVITLESDTSIFQYSNPFKLVGGSTTADPTTTTEANLDGDATTTTVSLSSVTSTTATTDEPTTTTTATTEAPETTSSAESTTSTSEASSASSSSSSVTKPTTEATTTLSTSTTSDTASSTTTSTTGVPTTEIPGLAPRVTGAAGLAMLGVAAVAFAL